MLYLAKKNNTFTRQFLLCDVESVATHKNICIIVHRYPKVIVPTIYLVRYFSEVKLKGEKGLGGKVMNEENKNTLLLIIIY